MADSLRRRLTPGQSLLLRLGLVLTIALFTEQVIFPPSTQLAVDFLIPMGIILIDGLLQIWAHARRAGTAEA